METMTGSRQFAEMLKGYSVDHVFFVPAIMMQALAELEKTGVRRIMAHSEKAAAYMADGYARASGKPGICMAQNIGGSNLASGLRDARMACSPIIAITGGPSPSTRYRNYYQEVDHFPQFDAVTKFNASVETVARLPDLLRQAFREATTGAPGPVHLQLSGVIGELTEQPAAVATAVQPQFAAVPAVRPQPPADQIETAAKVLLQARRPIIVAGGGTVTSGAQAELVALAEQLSIPVATALNAKGSILDTHPLSAGVVGTYSRECANRAVSMADVVFFVGSRTGSQVTHSWTVPSLATRIIHLDIEPKELGRNYPDTTPILGDARIALRQLLDALRGKSGVPEWKSWAEETRRLVAGWRASENDLLNSGARPIRPERLCNAISKVLPERGIVVSDTGHSGMWSSTMIDFTRPGQKYIRCAGSLGWSFPAALGIKCAVPDRSVVCFNGDGAFYYHLAELETAARHGINAVIVVNNNSAFNQEIHLVDDAYKGMKPERAEDLWKFRDVDFAGIAESFGCVGMRVVAPEHLEDTLQKALTANRPVVVDVTTDVDAAAKSGWRPKA